ncbi:EF-hand domain-containing protein [Streptomyces sp. WAC05374]|uniref:EF-hand domain-containing protein n=1 Tax=Streptomyces sp. WAC05374 TaxID=2487420 RepID=UPI000F871A17|nr:EF-hand domain-containing protein [Streptomyces sp. WAC05374]RST19675.1 EF-hand domain-containing protein [Streptomyces sp. WAC05374]TDF35313.1 EF-hand domain-containing protein [Streptomyces sp. WAC05374]TDF57714.1 EF-hand domain-containing protein [Streptomyces sp. WAC05374]TDF60242.1 EF-hand domain-containing protein [Streptomyces sp. WAC05374]
MEDTQATLEGMSDLRRRKLNRLFDVLDADRTGQIDAAAAERLRDRYVELAGAGQSEERKAQLGEMIRRLWTEYEQDGEPPPCDRDRFALEVVRDLRENPDRVIRMIGLITNVVFAVADLDVDGELRRGPAIRLAEEAMGLTPEEAAMAWQRLDTAGTGRLTYAEFLKLATEFVVSEDPEAPGNWFFGPY